MAILAECPTCKKRQAAKNRVCKDCGEDLLKAKRSNRVRYWIDFRLPNGKQRRELIGTSIEEARAAEGKRRAQKVEQPHVLEKLGEKQLTFQDLTDWYTKRPKVKRLSSFERVKIALAQVNKEFGDRKVDTIQPADLENYQDKRAGQGASPATIDMELSILKTMVSNGFYNDKVDGRAMKAFHPVERRLKPGSNARERILSLEEYAKLLKASSKVLRPILIVAFHTGMRRGELLNLKWSSVDTEAGFIRLAPEDTKEGRYTQRVKVIPVNKFVDQELSRLPRAIHHDFVFTNTDGSPVSKDSLKRAMVTACKSAGISYGMKVESGLRFHDIRATVDTNMDRAGVSESVRKLILGHTLRGMDAYYIRHPEEELKRAVDQYTEWLVGQLRSANVDQVLTKTENLRVKRKGATTGEASQSKES